MKIETTEEAELLAKALISSDPPTNDIVFLNYYAKNIMDQFSDSDRMSRFKKFIANKVEKETKAFFREAFAEEKEESKEEEKFYKAGQFFREKGTDKICMLIKTQNDCWQLTGEHHHYHIATWVAGQLPVERFIERQNQLIGLQFEPIEVTIKQNEVNYD